MRGAREPDPSSSGVRPDVFIHGSGGFVRLFPLSLVVLVVAAATDLHDWGDSLITAASAGVTLCVAVLLLGGPGARAVRSVEAIIDTDDVRVVRRGWRSVLWGAAIYLGGAAIIGAWLGSVSTYGLFGLVFSLAYVPDAMVVRRWEREQEARLAWRRRSRCDAFLHPFRSQKPIGVRDL